MRRVGLFWSVTAPKRVVGLDMAGPPFEVSIAGARAILASRGLAREHAERQPAFAPDVMMSR